jgi:exodeoxyribonuclease V alpha subunit
MTKPTHQKPKEEVTVLVTAVLRRGYQDLTVFSGKDESGKHIRAVAYRGTVSDVPALGEVWRINGEYKRDSIYGVQFYADRCEKLLPEGRLVVLYIANNPRFKGIGLGKAKKLYKRFGDELTRLLDEGNTAKLEEVLTPLAAQTVVEAWRNNRAESEVIAFLDKYNFNKRLASKVWRCWGDKAIEVLNRNPYCMLAFAGWEIVDGAARQLGVDRLDARRLIGAVESCLYARLNEKHTLTDHPALLQRVRYILGADTATAERAILFALDDKAIVGDAQKGYQPIGAASIETTIAKRLARIHDGETLRQGQLFYSLSIINPALVENKISEYEVLHSIRLNKEQRDAVMMGASQSLSILTGGAGVGKTTVLKIVIDIVEEAGGTVYQMALSGRAAQRMREATGHEAMTIAGFISNVQKGKLPIQSDSLIIIDEASMLDLPIMYRVIRNLPDGVRLLLVGDPYQLPPIGFGLVFHKLAESNTIPRVELTQVHRQAESTGIPAIAFAIRHGVVPQLSEFHGLGVGVSFINCPPEKIVDLLFDVSKEWGHKTDIKILGVTKSSEAGVRAINEYFHYSMSAGKRRLQSWQFAVGDPVIYLENDYERLLFNGTLGYITDVITERGEPAMSCDFDGVVHILKEPDMDKIALAYSITVHKAQGSQFNRIAIPITKSRLLDRTLIYTALTRGIEQVVLIGDRRAFSQAIASPPAVSLREVGLAI